MKLETLQTFDRSDAWTKNEKTKIQKNKKKTIQKKDKEYNEDKDQKESLILRCQGSFALLRCFERQPEGEFLERQPEGEGRLDELWVRTLPAPDGQKIF